MSVSVEVIKKLRAATGLGVHDIKKALEEASGDEARALELLKKRGLETVAKKSGRETLAGLIEGYVHAGRIGALVEVGCETDFVARNDEFKYLVKELAIQIASMNPQTVEELLTQEYFRDQSQTVGDLLNQMIAKLGEKLEVVRFQRLALDND